MLFLCLLVVDRFVGGPHTLPIPIYIAAFVYAIVTVEPVLGPVLFLSLDSARLGIALPHRLLDR